MRLLHGNIYSKFLWCIPASLLAEYSSALPQDIVVSKVERQALVELLRLCYSLYTPDAVHHYPYAFVTMGHLFPAKWL
jgi:hypothetical protein